VLRISKLSVAAGAAAIMLVASGCGPKQDARGYGDTARDHFLEGCTTERTVTGGDVKVDDLAPEEECVCVYDNIRTDNPAAAFPLAWDDLRTYEKLVENGDAKDLPAPPQQLTDAIDQCQTAGPVATTTPSE
jgi:hypothetical protein